MKYLFIMLMISGCGGLNGGSDVRVVTGPMGPTGLSGTNGVTGATGSQGQQGVTGSTGASASSSAFVSHSLPLVNHCYLLVTGVYGINKGSSVQLYSNSTCSVKTCLIKSATYCVSGNKLFTISGSNASMSVNELHF